MRSTFLALTAIAALAAPALARADDPAPASALADDAGPAVAAPPAAAPAAGAPAVAAPAAGTPAATPPLPLLGVSVEAGFPDGGAVALLVRPHHMVRLSVGPTWNYLGWGVEGGVALVPWHWMLSPVLAVEAGRFFDSDLTWLANKSGGVPNELEPLLKKVGYTYASAQLGVEIGSQRGFSFVLRAGLSWFDLVAHGTATTTRSGGTPGSSAAVVTLSDPRVHAVTPSVKLGVQYFF